VNYHKYILIGSKEKGMEKNTTKSIKLSVLKQRITYMGKACANEKV